MKTSKFEDKIDISKEEKHSSFVITSGKRYFSSMGKVYSAISSQYIEYFDKIRIEMSTSGQTYEEIQIHEDKLEGKNTDRMTEIGYINLDQIHHEIYIKRYVPPQELSLPLDVSKEDVLRSFDGHILVSPIKTRKDIVILIIVFIAALGTSFTILNSFKYTSEER